MLGPRGRILSDSYSKLFVGWMPYQSPDQHRVETTVTTLQSSSIPWLVQVFLTEALIFIKPPQVYRQTYVSWILYHYWQSILCMSTFTAGLLELCLFREYCNCSTTLQVNQNFPDFSMTNGKFPEFSRFSRWFATMPTTSKQWRYFKRKFKNITCEVLLDTSR